MKPAGSLILVSPAELDRRIAADKRRLRTPQSGLGRWLERRGLAVCRLLGWV